MTVVAGIESEVIHWKHGKHRGDAVVIWSPLDNNDRKMDNYDPGFEDV